MIPTDNKHSAKSSTSSEVTPFKVLDRSKRRSHTSQMSMTTKAHVAPTIPQIQAPQQYVSGFPAKAGYFRLCLNASYTSATCASIPLERRVVFLQQSESNKATAFGQKLNTPFRARPYYRAAAGPSAYRPQGLVPQHSNRSPPTFSCHEGGTKKTSTKMR